MPKAQLAVVESAQRLDRTKLINIHTQGKGGIFKSGSAWVLGQYLRETGSADTCCWDTDPVNHTLANVAGLEAKRVDILEHNRIEIRLFDPFVSELIGTPGPHVVDTGATGFLALWDYIQQNNLIQFLEKENGLRVLVHCPVVGGQSLMDTVGGFATLCRYVPDQSIVVWLNEYFGPVAAEGKEFAQFRAVTEHAEKIFGVVHLGAQVQDLYRMDLAQVLAANQTFEEAVHDVRYNVVQRHRLGLQKKELYDQLAGLGI